MKYTVVWDNDAEQELAAVWLAAPDRNAVTVAAYQIEKRLWSAPESEGESRFGNQRIVLVAPLGAIYDVYAKDLLVRVLHVWRFDTHSTDS